MLNSALNVVQKLEKNGFEAYIVGGFVRDYLLGISTSDVDICTSAKPKEIIDIFDTTTLSKDDYGCVNITYKKINFQVTTFRKEDNYFDYRHPEKIKYIDSLYEDLLRRDFTINTICIDKNGKIIDKLNGEMDLNMKIIKTVGNSGDKFHEDPLRILRAIRFAAKLDFDLSDEVISGIRKNKHLLKKISYDRKKQEIDKILLCKNAKKGIELLVELGIDKELEIINLKDIPIIDSLIGMWSLMKIPSNTYPFSNNEKKLIEDINKAIKLDNLDHYNLYKYGLYVNSIAGIIKNVSREKITSEYNKLCINSRKDIDITSQEIMDCLNIKPGPKISKIYEKLEISIINNELKNNKDEIIRYCLKNFSSDI